MAAIILEAGEWIYRMFFVLIVAVVSIGIVGWASNLEINTHDLQEQLLLNRILYSPNSIWYTQNSVMHTGVINREKFTQQTIDAAFKYPDNYGGAEIRLAAGSYSQTVYVNEPTYKSLYTQYAATFGDSQIRTYTYPVVVKDGPRTINGLLTVTTAVPPRT